MLEGIDILSKTMIKDTPNWASLMAVLSLACVVIFLSLVVMAIREDELLLAFIFGILLLISGGLVLFSTDYFDSIYTGRYRYEVVVNDDVSLTDFYEKYDVVEQNGRLWTIEEKGE